LHVVEWRIGHTGGIGSLTIGWAVRRTVPSANGQVEAAGKCHVIVDDDDLLMMRRTGRQRVVEAKLDLRRCPPLQGDEGPRFTLERVDDGKIPQQQLDRKIRAGAHQGAQEVAEGRRQAVLGLAAVAHEAHAAVDVPTDDVDGTPGIAHGTSYGAEIFRRIDEHGGAGRPLHAPRIATRTNHPFVRRYRHFGWGEEFGGCPCHHAVANRCDIDESCPSVGGGAQTGRLSTTGSGLRFRPHQVEC
jgi:hypothetical protein